jgi:hypothetical protein
MEKSRKMLDMNLPRWISLWLCLTSAACLPDAEGPDASHDGAGGGMTTEQGSGSSSAPSGAEGGPSAASGAGSGGTGGDAQIAKPVEAGSNSEPRDAAMSSGLDAGSAPAMNPATDAGSVGDAGRPAGYWDAAHPTVHRTSDGSVELVDVDAGPVLNPAMQARCLALGDAICTRVADCDEQVAHVDANQKATALSACKHAFSRSHNCNRATAVASNFDQCVQMVQAIECNQVFASDISGTCDSALTLQP